MQPFVKEELALFIMGGTIDSFLTGGGETEVTMRSTVRDYLTGAVQPWFDMIEYNIALKDSRKITDADRMRLYSSMRKHQPSKKRQRKLGLVTHGTFTLADTAEFLLARVDKLEDWTIVCLGSFWPLSLFQAPIDPKLKGYGSDAPFNLGFGIAALLYEKPGIYVAMNGRVFPAGTVYKDVKHNRYRPKAKT